MAIIVKTRKSVIYINLNCGVFASISIIDVISLFTILREIKNNTVEVKWSSKSLNGNQETLLPPNLSGKKHLSIFFSGKAVDKMIHCR